MDLLELEGQIVSFKFKNGSKEIGFVDVIVEEDDECPASILVRLKNGSYTEFAIEDIKSWKIVG